MRKCVNITYKNMYTTKYIQIRKLTSNFIDNLNKCNKLISSRSNITYAVYKRNLNINSLKLGKIFVEYENKYAHDVLQTSGYSNNLTPITIHTTGEVITRAQFSTLLEQNWANYDADKLLETFVTLSEYCSKNDIQISSNILDSFIDNFTDNIKYLTDEQLETAFINLSRWPETESVRTRNFIEVWAALDDTCVSRMNNWDSDKLLLFADYMFLLNIGKLGDYTTKCVRRLSSRVNKLTHRQLVQTIFYIGVIRQPTNNMFALESKLKECFELLNIDELGVLSMGLFKSQTPIRDLDLINKICIRVINESNTVKDITLCSILKIIRYSLKYTHSDIVEQLLTSMADQIDRISLMACIHVALLGTATNTFHPNVLSKIAQKVIDNISEARIKDLERLTFALETFNFNPPISMPFYEQVVEELRNPSREDEIVKYGRSFVCCLAYLTTRNIFPMDLIEKALNPSFLKTSYGNFILNYGREVLVLDKVIEVYCSAYEGNRLSRKLSKSLAKKLTDAFPEEGKKNRFNINDQILLDVKNLLRDTSRGEEFVCGYHILPQYQRGDIIICRDKNNEPVSITEYFPPSKFGSVIKVPDDGNNWIVFVAVGRNAYIKNTRQLVGPMVSKLNQLKTIGYKTALVEWHIWSKLKHDEEKILYINDLIKNI